MPERKRFFLIGVFPKWKVATGFFCCRWCLFHQRVDRRVPAWTFSRHRPAVVGYPRVACATDTCSCCENQYFYAIWLCFVRRQQPTTHTYISDKNRVSQTGTNVLEWEKQWPKWPREIIGILYAGNFWNLTFSGTSCINHHCEKACYIPMYKKGWSRSRSGLIFCRMKILTKPRKKETEFHNVAVNFCWHWYTFIQYMNIYCYRKCAQLTVSGLKYHEAAQTRVK